MNENEINKPINFKVIGVGGAGNNAINLILEEQQELANVELFVANTDKQDLAKSKCENKIYLGSGTRGFGAGSDPAIGRQCALESKAEIEKKLAHTDIVIIATGLGGGTGTGASPIIAEAAKEAGALTIAIVTTPFKLEGKNKRMIADEGLAELQKHTDAVIILSNQKLITLYNKLPLLEAFRVSNIALKQSIKAIHDTIFKTGYVNVDFNDLKKVLANGNESIINIGRGQGKDRAKKAVDAAFNTQLFEKEIEHANKIIVLFQCDSKTSLEEIESANDYIDELMSINSENIIKIIGIQLIDDFNDFFQVNIIASNINEAPQVSEKIVQKYETQYLELETTKERLIHDESKDSIPDFFKSN